MVGARVVVVGAGPAGLMAAQTLRAAGCAVQVFDAMPSAGRKFLRAGIGGLNLTHAEPFDRFVTRYGAQARVCTAWLQTMSPDAIRQWASKLGVSTFIGSSQRVFPTDMKAAPLLRAWLQDLQQDKPEGEGPPVPLHVRHRWTGALHPSGTNTTQLGNSPASPASPPPRFTLSFDTPQGRVQTIADAVVLALGGGSWAKLGADGQWISKLEALGIPVMPLQPANCGFDVWVGGTSGWSDYFAKRFAGTPMKGAALSFIGADGVLFDRRGEWVFTQTGIEGSLVYAASATLRDSIAAGGHAIVHLDLKPDWALERVVAALSQPKRGRSLSNHIQRQLGLAGLHTALLHELCAPEVLSQPQSLAAAIKHLPLRLHRARPIDEAISTAGGVDLAALAPTLMAKAIPGLFFAGEMLDWEAPTGGYLLSACLASGHVAGLGAAAFVTGQTPDALVD
jgi:uncharacterized flavoprotein (TIGR03862 family)